MAISPASSIKWKPVPRCPTCGDGITAMGRNEPFVVDGDKVYCRRHGASIDAAYPEKLREYKTERQGVVLAIRAQDNDEVAKAKLSELVTDLDFALVQRVEEQAKWFEEHRGGPRAGFRATGVLVIVLSAAVPVVAAVNLSETYKWLVPALAALVLVGTSIQTFFNWHGEWVVNYQTALGLRHVLLRWELTKVAARTQPWQQAQKTLLAGALEAEAAFGLLMNKESEAFATAVFRSASSLATRPEPTQAELHLEREEKADYASGFTKGGATARQEILIRLLENAKKTVTDEQRTKIQECYEEAVLDRWIDNATHAKTVAEALN